MDAVSFCPEVDDRVNVNMGGGEEEELDAVVG